MSTDILIIINPNSGTSQSEEYFQSFINLYPLDNYDLIISKNSNNTNLIDIIDNYKTVLIVGGDGTIFSFVQQFFNKNITFGHIPSGSGNGLTKSLLFSKNITFDKDLNVPYKNLNNALINKSVNKIDTMNVKLINSDKIIHSFLFISCGIFANLDLNTEWLRKLGDFRFTLGGIYQLLKYSIIGNSILGELEYTDEEDNKIYESGQFVFFLASNMSHTSRTTFTSPESRPDDGYIYISYLLEPTRSWNLLQILLNLDNGEYINRLKYKKCKSFKFEPSNGIYDIDGERFDIEPIEVSINPRSLNFLY